MFILATSNVKINIVIKSVTKRSYRVFFADKMTFNVRLMQKFILSWFLSHYFINSIINGVEL